MDRKQVRAKLDEIPDFRKQDVLEDILVAVHNCGQAGCFDEIFTLLNEYGLLEE